MRILGDNGHSLSKSKEGGGYVRVILLVMLVVIVVGGDGCGHEGIDDGG